MRSLERTLLASLSLALVLAFGVLLWISVSAIEALSRSYVQTRLEHDAESLLAAIELNREGKLVLRDGRLGAIYQRPLSGHYFLVEAVDGQRLRSRSLWDESLPLPAIEVGKVTHVRLAGPEGHPLLVRAGGYEKFEQRMTVAVAEDISTLTRRIQRYQWYALGALSLMVLIIVLMQWRILRKGFGALDQIRQEMQQVSEGGRQRVEALGPSEIKPLTTEINRLLDQQQQRLQRSRQALGNLAHALKSPLSLLMQEVDGLKLASEQSERLQAPARRIHELIQRELKRARIAGEGSAGSHFNAAETVSDLAQALRQIYRDKDLSITWSELPQQSLPLDEEDMTELLGNVLDNACKWAKHQVRLSMALDQGLQLSIEDDGPGVDAADYETVLRRGGRIDESHQGHGLGLAIVHDLVQDYGGSISFQRSSMLGGLEVLIHIPLKAVGSGGL